MKLGVLQFFSWPGRHGPLEEVYARALERIEIMDRTGFDAVWLAEHHFTTFSVCPSVHMLGTLAAARTKRLRIGTAVSLAALYHPLRLAEEVALLDMLSGGRVNWGAGRGFAQFGVQALRRAGRRKAPSAFARPSRSCSRPGPRSASASRAQHFSFDDVEVLPKPLQRPHPPTWMAATSEARDRLGGEPRLFHPDGPAFLDGGARRQAPALSPRSSPKRASPMPAATSRWRACSRWRRPRTRPRPSRAAARNGWSIPTPGRSMPVARPCRAADLRRQGAGAALCRQRHPARHARVGRRADRPPARRRSGSTT